MCSCTGAIISFSALPGPSGSGRVYCSPWYSSRSRASALRTIVHVLARALELVGEALAVPALGHLGAGRPDAEQHPPAREVVERGRGHRRHRRRAGRHLEDRRAELDRSVCAGEPGQTVAVSEP